MLMTEIHFAPLQGFTDLAYRNAHFQCVGDVDFYYTPYFSIDDKLKIDTGKFSEGLFDKTIPQILPGNLEELRLLSQFIDDLHFSSININIGCPYPMVTRRGRGAALIQKPTLVSEMVNYLSSHSNLKISLKTRLGLMGETEIFSLLEKLKPEKIDKIIIHPRTAKQLYKGKASHEMFKRCIELFTEFDFIYNGDINSIDDFSALREFVPEQQKLMLGRGLLSNPFLGWQIKNNSQSMTDAFDDKLQSFLFHLIENIETESNDQNHAMNRVKNQFTYLSNYFPEPIRVFRAIRKSKSLVEVRKFLDIAR
jgi:tRNA-dihydrouridine synthase B